MAKVDLKKVFRTLYDMGAKARTPHILEVPPLRYLMVDGSGNPNTAQDYADAITTLYSAAYGVKFASKETGADFSVMPLESLWWTDPPEAFSESDKEAWLWTAMILQPDSVTREMVDDARAAALEKGRIPEATAAKLRLDTLEEGTSVQVLHIGPYAEEAPVIASMHEFAKEAGYELRGKHHEIYMSDPRRTAPERLKTIIRQPLRKR